MKLAVACFQRHRRFRSDLVQGNWFVRQIEAQVPLQNVVRSNLIDYTRFMGTSLTPTVRSVHVTPRQVRPGDDGFARDAGESELLDASGRGQIVDDGSLLRSRRSADVAPAAETSASADSAHSLAEVEPAKPSYSQMLGPARCDALLLGVMMSVMRMMMVMRMMLVVVMRMSGCLAATMASFVVDTVVFVDIINASNESEGVGLVETVSLSLFVSSGHFRREFGGLYHRRRRVEGILTRAVYGVRGAAWR